MLHWPNSWIAHCMTLPINVTYCLGTPHYPCCPSDVPQTMSPLDCLKDWDQLMKTCLTHCNSQIHYHSLGLSLNKNRAWHWSSWNGVSKSSNGPLSWVDGRNTQINKKINMSWSSFSTKYHAWNEINSRKKLGMVLSVRGHALDQIRYKIKEIIQWT